MTPFSEAMAAITTVASFIGRLAVPVLGIIVVMVAGHLIGAIAYARRIARRARSELRAGHERVARGIILGMERGVFGDTVYRFLPQDLKDRFHDERPSYGRAANMRKQPNQSPDPTP